MLLIKLIYSDVKHVNMPRIETQIRLYSNMYLYRASMTRHWGEVL